jgi:hypothetical protein
MHQRTKALIYGAILGTIQDGLGFGTMLGAARAAQEYDRRFGHLPDDDGFDHGNSDTP